MSADDDRLDQPYELCAPAVISDEVDGEVLAIDLEHGIYYVVAPASAGVWRALTTAVPPRTIVADRSPEAATAVLAFLDRLLGAGLVRVATTAAALTAPVEWAGGPLELEAHDDMADLLGLDPIHDADDTHGWPTPREG
ncbi:MAG: hypothetical protein ACKOVH_11740 [Actinomycetota bacterium]